MNTGRMGWVGIVAEAPEMLKPANGRWSPDDLPEGAMGLRLVRIVQPGDRLRHYEAILFVRGRRAIAHFLAMQLQDASAWEPGYGLIDVLDAGGFTILGEIDVATADTFQLIRRKLGCRIDSTDGDFPLAASCPPAAAEGEVRR